MFFAHIKSILPHLLCFLLLSHDIIFLVGSFIPSHPLLLGPNAGENTVSALGRLVLILWLFVVLIINLSYMASLTSILTVQQLSSRIEGLDSSNIKYWSNWDSSTVQKLENTKVYTLLSYEFTRLKKGTFK